MTDFSSGIITIAHRDLSGASDINGQEFGNDGENP
jgi:hypothetical protein